MPGRNAVGERFKEKGFQEKIVAESGRFMPKKSEKQTYAAAGVDRDGHSDITQGLRSKLTRNDPVF